MNDQTQMKPASPTIDIELVTTLNSADLNDLCDATDEAILAGGGFGWVQLPAREILELLAGGDGHAGTYAFCGTP